MLTRETYINEIENRLSWIELTVRRRNSLNLYDVDIHAESLFCELLNLVFGYKLENLNHFQKNFDSIDLGDKENRISIQVTAQDTRAKVQGTLDKFVENEHEKEYDRLVVLIIGTKPKFRKPFNTGDNLCFDADTDVWDINYLLRRISEKPIGELSQICTFFKEQLYPNEGYTGVSLIKLGTQMLSEMFFICKEKLLSIGISDRTADEIIKTDIGSTKYQYILDEAVGGKRYLIGEFGSGKSHALLIIAQQLMNEYLAGNSTVFPLYVRGKEISRIGSVKQWLKDLKFDEVNYFLLIDGLDEIDRNFTGQLIEEINVLSIQYPQNKILAASRPLTVLNIEIDRTFNIHPLTDNECLSLYNIVSNDESGEQAFRWINENMRKTLSKPFFCIIFALSKSEPSGWAKQDIDLIIALVTKSVQKAGQHAELAFFDLASIASKAVDRDFRDVHTSEIHYLSSLENVLATGFISLANDYISFPLPIIAQWMAAQAIRRNIVNIDDIISDSYRMNKWLYSLSILFSQISFEESLDIFSRIVQESPGNASRIICDGIRFDTMISLPTAYECGLQLQQAMGIWVDSLGLLSKWIAPFSHGKLKPLGIEVDDRRITYTWMDLECSTPVQVLSYQEMRRNRGTIHSRGVPAQATWPWILTFDYLSNRLKKVINSRLIFTDEGQLQKEYLWSTLLRISGKGSLYEKEVDLTAFDAYRKFIGHRWEINGKAVSAEFLFHLIDDHIKNGKTTISAPYPVSDKPHRSGEWVWSSYSTEQLLKKTQFIYGSALSEYMRIVDTVFSKLKKSLEIAKLAPCELVGGLEFQEEDTTSASGPSLVWYVKALPISEDSNVNIQLQKISFNDDNLLRLLIQHNLKMRPEFENSAVAQITSQYLDIFSSTPVTNIVFSWLKEELKEIGWIDGI